VGTVKSEFWQLPQINNLQSLSFHLEDTSASTLPLSNLTQIFPDWWADRIGVLELALPVITGRAAERVYTVEAEHLSVWYPVEPKSDVQSDVAKRCQSVWYSSSDTGALSDRPSRFFF
jgi:hypothetical protein